MLTIKNLNIFSVEKEMSKTNKDGLCIFNFTQPVLFVDCVFDDCAKIHIENNPHLFAVI